MVVAIHIRFGLFQGPLAEELGWRGFLLPASLRQMVAPKGQRDFRTHLGRLAYQCVFFSPISTWALFTASAVALSVLMTVLFLHTRGSVLLAIVMHWSVMPGKYIVSSLFPAGQEPPNWLRAVVAITVAVIVVAVVGRKLSVSAPNNPILETSLNHEQARHRVTTVRRAARLKGGPYKLLARRIRSCGELS